MLNNISIILTRPQLGQNIGAAARVMKNFGLRDLRIVSPRDGWPNEKADAMAAGAKDIIENAKIFKTTEEAVEDMNFLYATTARKRDMTKEVFFPESLAERLSATEKTGIMFGQENNGLDNEDISLANAILTIPVGKEYSSLNLAQSVCITAYEIFKNADLEVKNLHERNLQPDPDVSERKDIIDFINFLEKRMDDNNFYSVPEKKEGMLVNIRNIFTRHHFTKQEIRTLRGILKDQKD